ncbi:hypothetical protein ABH15_08925 [Methanoculleus taiwanensis]|uniref:DUF3821 domain-containing protein n=1 Tax=Methanoculleus taiwanensis TaxID=1550565 RepID=A0A498H005_9EURY|nr:hypothetical protein [Methanoculleus taiwanensis]RXE56251.1 hypothetical protein ABH15_08925 [Methanoculleus taiwanensis]
MTLKTAAALVIALLLAVPLASAGNLTITQPSANETVFAEMRDFYVYGVFPAPLERPGNIRITVLDADGIAVRTVASTVNESGITPAASVDMTLVPSKWGAILAPDAITEPGGIGNGSNKLLVTGTYYLALVQGGATKDMGSYTDLSGGALSPITRDLTAGTYTVVVEGLDGDLAGERVEKQVTFGRTHASLGLFRPEANRQNVIAWALCKNPSLRTYLDWFPGYFREGEAGYEIPERWQTNNAIEVANDLPGALIDTLPAAENDYLVYNVGNTSTTRQVELAAILRCGLVDVDGTTFTHYDVGEPSLAWTDRVTGEAISVNGSLTPYPADTRIVFTRAEITREPVCDNYYSTVAADSRKTVDTTPLCVTITQGDNLTFYGVTRPIATTLTGAGSAYRYSPDDQILTYAYENETLGRFTFTGCLVREFADGYLGYANYEFGHAFADTAAMPAGTWLLSVSGYTTAGALVEETNTTIELEVVPVPAAAAAAREAPGLWILAVVAVLGVGAALRRG